MNIFELMEYSFFVLFAHHTWKLLITRKKAINFLQILFMSYNKIPPQVREKKIKPKRIFMDLSGKFDKKPKLLKFSLIMVLVLFPIHAYLNQFFVVLACILMNIAIDLWILILVWLHCFCYTFETRKSPTTRIIIAIANQRGTEITINR